MCKDFVWVVMFHVNDVAAREFEAGHVKVSPITKLVKLRQNIF